MKKFVVLILVIAAIFTLAGCTSQPNNPAVATAEKVSYENGTYRGTFSDKDKMQVGIEFKLENNVVKEIKFRHLEFRDVNYLEEENDKLTVGLKDQYVKAIEHLVGKDIRDNLADLYEPGNIVTENVDAFTGATIRSNKAISAIRDGLNRGVYSY